MGTTSGEVSSHEKMNTLGYIKQSFCLSKIQCEEMEKEATSLKLFATHIQLRVGHQSRERPGTSNRQRRATLRDRGVTNGEHEDPKCY